jgi:hypothetical protein
MKRWAKRLPLWLVIPGAFVAIRWIKFAFGRLFESLLGMDGLPRNLTPVAFAADLALGLTLALLVGGIRRLARAK